MTTAHQSHSLYNNDYHHHHHHHHLVSLVHFCELNGPSVIFVTQPTLSGDNSTNHQNSHSNPDNQSQSHQNSNPNLPGDITAEDAVVGSQNLDPTGPHVLHQPKSPSSNRTRAKPPLNSLPPSSPQSPQHHTPSCPACSPWYPAAAELPTVLKECVDAFPSFVCINNEAKSRSRQGSKGDINMDENPGINDDGNGGIRAGTGHDSAINIQINVKQPNSPISPVSHGSNESEGNSVKSVITSDPLVKGTKYFSSRYPLEVGIYSVLRTACVRSLSCELTPTRSGGPVLFSFTSAFSSTDSSIQQKDTQFYVLAYLFQLNDNTSRGSVRSYAFVYLSQDRESVVNRWDGLVSHFATLATNLQSLSEQVATTGKITNAVQFSPTKQSARPGTSKPDISRSTMSQNQSRDQTQNKASVGTLSPEQFLRRCGNPQPSIRSLVEIVGVKSVFISLHLHFAFILRNIIYPPISPSSIPPRLIKSTYASVFRSSIESSSLDSPDQSRGESISPYLFLFDLFGSMSRYSFMHLLNHVAMGDQIIVRGDEEPVMKIIHVLKIILPPACITTPEPMWSETYHESWECNIQGLSRLTDIPYEDLKSSGIGYCLLDIDFDSSDESSGCFLVSIDAHQYGDIPPLLVEVGGKMSGSSDSSAIKDGGSSVANGTDNEADNICCGFTYELMKGLSGVNSLVDEWFDDHTGDEALEKSVVMVLEKSKSHWISKSSRLLTLTKSPSYTPQALSQILSLILPPTIATTLNPYTRRSNAASRISIFHSQPSFPSPSSVSNKRWSGSNPYAFSNSPAPAASSASPSHGQYRRQASVSSNSRFSLLSSSLRKLFATSAGTSPAPENATTNLSEPPYQTHHHSSIPSLQIPQTSSRSPTSPSASPRRSRILERDTPNSPFSLTISRPLLYFDSNTTSQCHSQSQSQAQSRTHSRTGSHSLNMNNGSGGYFPPFNGSLSRNGNANAEDEKENQNGGQGSSRNSLEIDRKSFVGSEPGGFGSGTRKEGRVTGIGHGARGAEQGAGFVNLSASGNSNVNFQEEWERNCKMEWEVDLVVLKFWGKGVRAIGSGVGGKR